MANDTANNAKKEKFIDLLHELFQLNQPELDFGLYRIMHAKSGQIRAFIENDLAREIDEAFAAGGDDKVGELKAAYEQARAQAKEFGIDDPDSNPKVKEAKEAYDAARENGDDPSDIYDHLYRFFSRYYDKGDFLSRRYHVAENDSRAAPYAVPYDGREVYLHWANKDQYYIKSSEYFSNFSFDLAEALKKERQRQGAAGQGGFDFEAENAQPLKVTFQLVEAAEGAHNNVKENQSRFFIIHAENPVELRGGRQDGATELVINFEYRPDPEKSGQEGTWQKKRLEEAEAAILDALQQDDKAKAFHEALAFIAPTEKQRERTLLGKYLASYTARNTMDYFIHKDLGGFLRREMDFYIKNEIMRLDDLSAEDITGVTRSLKKITALRTIARQIIDFLAQLEEFQKKLWLKKKFVTEVNYCITLDRVPASFYDEIAGNERQWAQWEELGFITKDTKRTKETLTANPYMMVDTGLCDDNFKARLSAEIEEMDEKLDGIAINAENYQSMRLLKKKLEEKVKCVYIDPPYNTGGDGFAYKDGYQHASWLSMITERLAAVYPMLSKQGVLFSSIDAVERNSLENSLDVVFGRGNRVEEIIWVQNTTKNQSPTYSTNHEYIEVYSKSIDLVKADYAMFRESKPGYLEIMELLEKLRPDYPPVSEIEAALKALFREHKAMIKEEGEDALDDWKGIYNYNRAEYRDNYGRYVEENDARKKHAHIWVWREDNPSMPQIKEDSQKPEFRDPESPTFRFYQPTHPATGKPCPAPKRGWSWPFEPHGKQKNCFSGLAADHRIAWGEDENKIPQTKRFLHEVETNVAKSVVNDYTDGEKELTNLFGESRTFGGPKPTTLIQRFCQQSAVANELVCDFFAGSGTTGHAVINLNHEDGLRRKYLLIEMGEHFDTVLLPRLQKVVFSKEWKDGKPKSEQGISHCFKYVRLESYEDTLNNLMLDSDKRRAEMLAQEENTRLRKDYLLHYFLDVETRGSASLLNVEQFRDPTAYTLMVKKPGSDAQVPVTVDLVETFNWLIGLEVALLDRPRTYAAEFEREKDPELPEDQHTRLKVTRFKEIPPSPQPSPTRGEGAGEGFWFRIVEGYVRRTPGSDADKEKVMVVWRKLTDDPEQDAAALEALLDKYRVNQADSEFDKIYINGPHGLTLSGQAKARLLSLEETFMARMWEGTEQGALH